MFVKGTESSPGPLIKIKAWALHPLTVAAINPTGTMAWYESNRPYRREEASNSVIAAFDDWPRLDAAIAAMNARESYSYCAVLQARGEGGPEACNSLHKVTRLRFTESRICIPRNEGSLSTALADALSRGTHTFASALRDRVSDDQARHLEDHIARGRLLLWIRPQTPDHFGGICDHLLRATPHAVEICKAEKNQLQSKRVSQ